MAAGDPVATSFQAPAGQNIDNAKADALNNIAQSGAKGAAQMAATAQANAAARTQALQNAMAYSALRGAPSGNVDAAQSAVAQPFDQRASVLGLMNDNYAQNNQAMQQANTNYMGGVKAGLPIAQTALDRTISNNQAANAAKRDQQNYELSLKQQMADDAHQTQDLSRQIAQARLQAIQDKANTPETLGKFITSNGGADQTGDYLKSLHDQIMAQEQQQLNADVGQFPALGAEGDYVDPNSVLDAQIPGGYPGLSSNLIAGSLNKDISQQNALNSQSRSASGYINPSTLSEAAGVYLSAKSLLDNGGKDSKGNVIKDAPKTAGDIYQVLVAKYGEPIAAKVIQTYAGK